MNDEKIASIRRFGDAISDIQAIKCDVGFLATRSFQADQKIEHFLDMAIKLIREELAAHVNSEVAQDE